jgi:hypothetical protein
MKHSSENEGRKSHVIEKIKRISVAMDRGEFWTWILLTGLFAVMALGLVYYVMQ